MKFQEHYFDLVESSYGIGDNIKILNPSKYGLKPFEDIGFVRGFWLSKGGLTNVPGYGIGPNPQKKAKGLKIELKNGKEIFVKIEDIKTDLIKLSEAKVFADEVKLLIEGEAASIGLDPQFISRLCNYLEKRFPNYGDFDFAVGNEIRLYMQQSDNTYVKKVKQRIHDIINKAKAKFLRDIYNKVEKVKVLPKEKPKPPTISGSPISDDPMAGADLPNVS